MTRDRNHTPVVVRILCILAAAVPGIVLADKTEDKDFAAFRKKESAVIEAELAAIPANAANDPLISASRSAEKDVDAIVTKVLEAIDEVRSTAVGSMVNEAIGVSSGKSVKTFTMSHADQVREVYVQYRDRIDKYISAASADTPEGKNARKYIDATLTAAEKFILIHAGKIRALGADVVAAEWLTLVPLLREGNPVWNTERIDNLPAWMKNTQSLNAAEYICLAVGRPRDAYQLWGYQILNGKKMDLKVENYLANLHRRANACFGTKDFLKGIAILKATVVLADMEGMVDNAVKSHFHLAEVYTMYGHSRLAAGEMKSVITTYPTHKECGKATLMRLRYLYQSSMFDKIIEETPSYIEHKTLANYRPQIIYIAWVTNRRQNKTAEADDLKKLLLRDYPNHILCADLYFSTAMEFLAAGDYAGATRLLDMISERYDETTIAAKSKDILAKLKESQKSTTQTPISSHKGD